MIIKNNPNFGKPGNNNCNEKNVWIQFTDELEWVETIDLSMCYKYYCKYNLHCLLVGRQQFGIEFVPTIWRWYQGRCFFWKQKHMKILWAICFIWECFFFVDVKNLKQEILFFMIFISSVSGRRRQKV
jgi:hypothetical protein